MDMVAFADWRHCLADAVSIFKNSGTFSDIGQGDFVADGDRVQCRDCYRIVGLHDPAGHFCIDIDGFDDDHSDGCLLYTSDAADE